jgi:hypothetical protein
MRGINDPQRGKTMPSTSQYERSIRDERPSPQADAKAVPGRRELHFASLDDVLGDAEKLVSSPMTRTLGNWPLDRLLTHVAMAMETSIDGISFAAPRYMRLLARLGKRRILQHGLSPGFKLPRDREAGAYPEAQSLQEALARLRRAVERMRTEKATASHPAFGRLTHEEWVQFHLRHAELHLSFAVLS